MLLLVAVQVPISGGKRCEESALLHTEYAYPESVSAATTVPVHYLHGKGQHPARRMKLVNGYVPTDGHYQHPHATDELGRSMYIRRWEGGEANC